jgi:hypothetical protein
MVSAIVGASKWPISAAWGRWYDGLRRSIIPNYRVADAVACLAIVADNRSTVLRADRLRQRLVRHRQPERYRGCDDQVFHRQPLNTNVSSITAPHS